MSRVSAALPGKPQSDTSGILAYQIKLPGNDRRIPKVFPDRVGHYSLKFAWQDSTEPRSRSGILDRLHRNRQSYAAVFPIREERSEAAIYLRCSQLVVFARSYKLDTTPVLSQGSNSAKTNTRNSVTRLSITSLVRKARQFELKATATCRASDRDKLYLARMEAA